MKNEKNLKIRQNCRKDVKKGLKNVSSSQNIQCQHVFFSKGHIKGQKQIVGFEGGGRGAR